MSGLYPATLPVYRKAGYEQAGHRWETRLTTRLIGVRERGAIVRRERAGDAGDGGDAAAIEAVYADGAAAQDGFMDRTGYVWEGKVRRWGTTAAEMFVVEEAGVVTGDVTGYVSVVRHRAGMNSPPEMLVRDWGARTPAAARAILSFLGDHWSTVETVTLGTGPMDPVLGVLGERIAQSRVLDQWMIRLVDVGAAMTQRGYSCGDGRVVFEVEDDLVAGNRGRWALVVRDGAGAWERCDGGDVAGADVVRCGARGLAQVYSGYRPAAAVRLAGLIDGSDAAMAALDRVFGAGSGAWMREIY